LLGDGSLEIFVGNLPGDVEAPELRVLFNNVLRKNVFDKIYSKLVSNGLSNACFRICEKELQGSVVLYGHIDVDSEKLANIVIDVLDQMSFNGCNLVVREYRHRTYKNDRRNAEWRENPWRNDERRLTERRDVDEYFG